MVCCVQSQSKVLYEIAVADRAHHIAAIAVNGQAPDLCMALGAMANPESFAMDPELISEGRYLQFARSGYVTTITALLTSVTVRTDPLRAQTLREKAEDRWFPTLLDWKSHREAFQAQYFAKSDLPEVSWILGLFSPYGRGYALRFLINAQKVEKLRDAIASLATHYDEYWVYMDPKVSGMILNESDERRWELIYREVDVPFGE